MRLEEACVNDKIPIVLRVIAGLLCLLTHGTLRWSDAQRTLELVLGKDLLRATRYPPQEIHEISPGSLIACARILGETVEQIKKKNQDSES